MKLSSIFIYLFVYYLFIYLLKQPIFKEFYVTPAWLKAHASYMHRAHSTTDHQITFTRGAALGRALLLKAPLVDAGVLSDETPLTVEITLATDVSIGQNEDSDPWYGLSDGTNFAGFVTPDKTNYAYTAPCFGVEGTSGASISARQTIAKSSPKPTDNFFPEQFEITLKLDKQWGSCFTTHDEGFTKTAQYSKRLKLSQGLALEVYKGNNKEERVGIKYIKVNIRKTD